MFATLAGDGHFNPLTGLAKYLQGAGCEVAWYSSKKYAERLKNLGIRHFPYVQALEITHIDENFPERSKIKDPIERINFDTINGINNRAPEFYEDMRALHAEFPFELLVADHFFTGMPFVRYKMKIPVVSIGVMPLVTSGDGLAPYGMALPPAGNEEERVKYGELRRSAEEVLFKPSIDSFKAILDNYGIPHRDASVFDILVDEADLHLQIGAPSFEYRRKDLGDNIRFIGALYPYSSPAKGKPWFDERLREYAKVVLVTQGTLEKDIEKILAPTLEAFADTDVLVIATTGGHGTAELRKRFPYENIIVEDNIPFNEVMPFADVYVTNGGYGGVLLSISHQLPMVAAGVHELKNEICTRIGYFRLGIDLKTEKPGSGAIRQAVDSVMADSSYSDSVSSLSLELNGYQSVELCAGYIADLLCFE